MPRAGIATEGATAARFRRVFRLSAGDSVRLPAAEEQEEMRNEQQGAHQLGPEDIAVCFQLIGDDGSDKGKDPENLRGNFHGSFLPVRSDVL